MSPIIKLKVTLLIVGVLQFSLLVHGAASDLEKTLESELFLTLSTAPEAARVLDTDLSYLDCGSEGVVIALGTIDRLTVVLANRKSDLAKADRQVIVISPFASLSIHVELQPNSRLPNLLKSYLRKAIKPKSERVHRRIDLILELCESLTKGMPPAELSNEALKKLR